MLLEDDRKKYAAGGILKIIQKVSKKKAPTKATEKDIDKLLKGLTEADMEKLTPAEVDQLLELQIEKYGVDNIPTKSTKKDIDDILDSLTDKELEDLTPIEREQLLDMELEKYGKEGRKSKMSGGMLSDDREKYGVGGAIVKAIKKGKSKQTPKYKEAVELREKELEKLIEEHGHLQDNADRLSKLDIAESDERLIVLRNEFKENKKKTDEVRQQLKDLGITPRTNKKDGGMLPDEDMEDNYMEFIMAEALSEEEEDMLTTKLEQDEQLAMLFDKVVDVAQEFAGSGPVEGPGSGVSDSIPARLSDGEFVFTAKAVEEIGADKLMAMMKNAEAKADERQPAYNGGPVGDQLEKVVQTETRITKPADSMSPVLGAVEDNLIQEEVTRNMLDPRVPHVRS